MPDTTNNANAGSIGAKITLTPEERDALILGHPPRIPPLTPEEYTPEVRQVAAELRAAAGLPPSDYIPEFVATMLRHPKLCREHTDLATLLMSRGTLSHRDRELAVLRTGWLCQAPFEFGSHVQLGKRVAGISDEEIEWVITGSTAPGWSTHDRAVIRAVEELFENAMISGQTWEILEKTWDYQQCLEFPILIGQYIGVAFVQNSIRARLMPGADGLSAR